MSQNYINHIALVLDASSSMHQHTDGLIKVADAQIAKLAQQSKDRDQETRVTVYSFADQVTCLIYDKDVLRLPSIASLYRAHGNTALINATITSIVDLETTPQKYGDHSFLIFVLTDGEENASQYAYRFKETVYNGKQLQQKLSQLPDNWTVAALVPNVVAKRDAQAFGFPAGNIAVWDTTSQQGLEEAIEKISTATDSYMTMRTTGTRGSKTLFGGANQVNAASVAATGLPPLDRSTYKLHPIPGIPEKTEVQKYIQSLGLPFKLGTVFYQLSKPEKVQAGKTIAVREKKTDRVFMGPQVRGLLNLPDTEVRIHPDTNPAYDVFIQSNSTNRHLVPHTTLLILGS